MRKKVITSTLERLVPVNLYQIYENWLQLQIEGREPPQHIALILDGNRRWARSKELNPWLGHHRGAQKVEELLNWCLELGIKTLTLYAFSTENFKRPAREVDEIMKLVAEKLQKLTSDPKTHQNRIRIKIIGKRELLPPFLQPIIREAELKTARYDKLYLNIALAYGGRAEIIEAVKKIAERVKAGELSPQQIDEKTFERYLYTSHLPRQEPDLIIRTSGEERLSGFLLWQSAYSELYFLDVFWPEFRKIDLLRAIRTFQKRNRRFGK